MRLLWAGFGRLQAGLWIAPSAVDVTPLIDDLGTAAHVKVFPCACLPAHGYGQVDPRRLGPRGSRRSVPAVRGQVGTRARHPSCPMTWRGSYSWRRSGYGSSARTLACRSNTCPPHFARCTRAANRRHVRLPARRSKPSPTCRRPERALWTGPVPPYAAPYWGSRIPCRLR